MKSTESFRDIKSIQVSISSPEEILQRSNGEVTNTKSINYKTMHAERGGLFCETIFGPMKEYECRCGALEGIDQVGKKCGVCGVEVNSPRMRRYRMGHIVLASAVPHVWFLKIRPFYLVSLMGIRMKDLENLLLSRSEIISTIRPRSVRDGSLSSHRYRILQGKKVYKGSGCEIVHSYLSSLDLPYEYLHQRSSIISSIKPTVKQATASADIYYNYTRSQYFLNQLKRLRILECFLRNHKRPEWMLLKVIPVLPPELRPFLLMDNNLVVSSDLNFLYKRIVERNARLKTLYKLRENDSQYALASFYYNELCMLQHAVDSLIENGRRGKAMLSRKQIPLRSLTHVLKGKEGRFRMNLLGKRVDLSARTVISVGPRLKMTQCGLPLSIALVLFKSIIYDKLSMSSSIPKKLLNEISKISRGNYSTKESLLNYLHASQVMSEIEKIAHSNPVLLNRAPTLHRLNIQAFQPIVINTKALQLHPLVCSSFNADFDGDQMAIHMPLSLSSQIESRVLMMTYNNIINPANGFAIISPTQDVVFGIYYASEVGHSSQTIHSFYTIRDVRNAYYSKYVSLHTPIYFYTREGNLTSKHFTTPGRVFLYQILPQDLLNFSKINKSFTKKSIQDLIQTVYNSCNAEDFLFFLDNLMAFGFYYAHISGISLSLTDVSIPSLKPHLVSQAFKKYNDFARSKSLKGLAHSADMPGNKSIAKLKQRMVSQWFKAQEDLTSLILKDVYGSKELGNTPPLFMLVHSGARGSILQMRQLSGMRGLMVKPSGDLIEMPIAANFKEGLSVLEYFYSTHGARKGVIDTSIRTATSGYLTRRLVHAVQDLVISEEDCGSSRFLSLRPEYSSGKEERPVSLSSYSRVSRSKAIDPLTSKVIIFENKLVDSFNQSLLSPLEELRVRSPLTCESKDGICRACYGGHLSHGTLVPIGEAVGILSAQSIGEPGTQLTMRTFHMGGVLLGNQSANRVRALTKARVYLKSIRSIPISGKNKGHTTYLNISNCGEMYLVDTNDRVLSRYSLPSGSMIYVKDGLSVVPGQILFQWNPYYEPIVYKGLLPSHVKYSSLEVREKKVFKLSLECTSARNRISSSRIELARKSSLEIDHIYFYHPKDVLVRRAGERVVTGDILFLYPRSQQTGGDITGGLSKISQLFEGSYPNKGKSLSVSNGWYFVRPLMTNTDLKWVISTTHYGRNMTYITSINQNMRVRSFTFLHKGDSLLLTSTSMYEILSIYGPYQAIKYLKREILSIYQANGVTIHDKHIELILKRMFGRIEIMDRGSSPYVVSETVELQEFIYQNILSLSKGLMMARGKVCTRGVTTISLDSKSFLSASSFQNTAQVLTSSSMLSRVDKLTGLGENVILGRLSPIGSASFAR